MDFLGGYAFHRKKNNRNGLFLGRRLGFCEEICKISYQSSQLISFTRNVMKFFTKAHTEIVTPFSTQKFTHDHRHEFSHAGRSFCIATFMPPPSRATVLMVSNAALLETSDTSRLHALIDCVHRTSLDNADVPLPCHCMPDCMPCGVPLAIHFANLDLPVMTPCNHLQLVWPSLGMTLHGFVR